MGYNKAIVVKRSVHISILVVSLSLTFLFILPAVNAEPRKDGKVGLAAELHLETSTLPKATSRYGAGKDRTRRVVRGFLVPLKEGVNAFLDLTPPVLRGLETKNNQTAYRAVIGFHFPLR